uniref:Uncharacterized protein n=1 Tax=Picea sitchensis TaxID=3332 RepID=D5AAV6_PICSI|nr:unknown [Picea sitchensis]
MEESLEHLISLEAVASVLWRVYKTLSLCWVSVVPCAHPSSTLRSCAIICIRSLFWRTVFWRDYWGFNNHC